MNKFYEFMRGRYGADELSAVITLLALVLFLVVSVLDIWWLSFLPLVLVIYAAYRILSKDISARQRENAFIVNFKQLFAKGEKKPKSSDYVIAKCPVCSAKLRLPKGRGEFIITCPSCKKKMRVRS